MIARKRLIALAALACSLVLPPAAQADFGLVPGSATVTAPKQQRHDRRTGRLASGRTSPSTSS